MLLSGYMLVLDFMDCSILFDTKNCIHVFLNRFVEVNQTYLSVQKKKKDKTASFKIFLGTF